MRHTARSNSSAAGPRDLPAGAQAADAAPGAVESCSDEQDARETRIREAAYRLYEQRGGGDGRDIDDWLEAEAMLAQHDAGELQASQAADAGL